MIENKSSVLLLDPNGEHHSVAVDENWRVIADESEVTLGTTNPEVAVVIDGLIRAVDTVVDSRELSEDIKNQAGLPEKVAKAKTYNLRSRITSVIGLIIADEELSIFSRHLHQLGRGNTSCYMLIDDESCVDARLRVFGEFLAGNECNANELILESLRALPLGVAMRRTVGSEGGNAEHKSIGHKVNPDLASVRPVIIEREKGELSGRERVMYHEALTRCSHLDIAGMSPYKIIILDMIMRSGAPVSDKGIVVHMKETLGSSYSSIRAEAALTSMYYYPFVGSISRVGVHNFKQAGEPVVMFRRVLNKPQF